MFTLCVNYVLLHKATLTFDADWTTLFTSLLDHFVYSCEFHLLLCVLRVLVL